MLAICKNKSLPFAIGLPLFFCFHHYTGIVIDAILYYLQYINSIHPERFLDDPMFSFGNQDSYGFFTPILSTFLSIFPVNQGMMLFCILTHLGTAIAIIFFIKSIHKCTQTRLWIIPATIIALALCADGMPHTKIKFALFIQNYTCSRLLSLALGIGSLSAFFYNKKYLSVILAFLGTIIHPLTAGWVLPLWTFFYFPKTRKIVASVALLIPLTYLIHQGALDSYPDNWLKRPLELGYKLDEIFLGITWIIFFYYFIPKYSSNSKLQNFSISLILTYIIASYWNIAATITEHILLYQVQTWRVEWIPAIAAFPLFFILAIPRIKNIYKTKKMTTYDFALFLIGCTIWIPGNLWEMGFAAIYFRYRKEVFLNIKHIASLLLITSLYNICLQQYLYFCMAGYPALLGFDFFLLTKKCDALILFQAVFSFILFIHQIKKRKFIFCIILFFFFIFPSFLAIPAVASLYMLFQHKFKEKKCFYIVSFLAFALFDGFLNISNRITSITGALPHTLTTIILILTICSICWMLTIFLKRKQYRFYQAPILCLPLFLIAVAFNTYDKRTDFQKINEPYLNQFVETSVFPQTESYGKTLFHIEGGYHSYPRLQFSTGAYLDYVSYVGSLFHYEHFREASKRFNLLAYKTPNVSLDLENIYASKISPILENRDSLIDRIQFLCNQSEIQNVITSVNDLPFFKQDSSTLQNNQKISLYSCNE